MYLRSTFLPLLFLLVVFQSPQDSLRQHYEAAEAHRRAGDLAAAETEFKAILAEGYGKLGKIYAAQKAYGEAVAALESAALYRPDNQEVLVDLAIAYFDRGQYKKALEPLSKALARDPQSAGAHHMMGKTAFMLGDFAMAVSELEAAGKLAPDDYDIAYTLGLAYLKRQQFAPAKKIYDRMLAQLGDRPQLHIIFGRAYRETEFLPESIEEFKKAIALDPHFPRAHYYLGLTYLLKDGVSRIKEAAEEFKIELKSNPEEFFANYYLGIVYIIERDWNLSINFLQKASRLQPDNPDPYFHLGQAYQSVEKHEQAVEVLRKSIALNPFLGHNDNQVTTAHYRLGQSLIKLGRTAEGEKELQTASELKSKGFKRDQEKTATYLSSASMQEQNSKFLELDKAAGVVAESPGPDRKTSEELKAGAAYYAKVVASAHNSIGLLRADGQDFRGAAEQFSLAAKWNPQLADINFNRGLAAFKAGLYGDAIAALEDELKAHPNNITIKKLLGQSYFMSEDYPKASQVLADLVAADTGDVGLYYMLSLSLAKQGKKEAADRVIQQMVVMGGNSPQLHILLGQAYYSVGETPRALEELKAALALDKSIRLAHYYSGLIYVKLGKLEDAAREFEAELALNPQDVQARFSLGFVLLSGQETDRGLKLMQEIIRLRPDFADAHYELGKALLQKGEIKEAVESLERAVRLAPDKPHVHYQLGRAYLAAGRKADGETQLELSKSLKEKERNQTNPSNP
ncbi:MAG TPA: tetratricopeptide repeat protein [Pyrinomonadaceae bacterium]|jgi:tetratricopeptide (TPR) repeat protein|nr:tetratricopeptide repeat protein [Pyrinomonadaceae bacterium]